MIPSKLEKCGQMWTLVPITRPLTEKTLKISMGPKNAKTPLPANLAKLTIYSFMIRAREVRRPCPHVHMSTFVHSYGESELTAMARNRRSAKQAGSATERAVADYLAAKLDDRIDRRVKTGARDKGDIAGVRAHGQRLVLEVKDCAKTDLPGWTAQAHLEADNDTDANGRPALAGIVVAKRRGTTDPGRYWIHATVDDLLALITGHRHGHRQENTND